MTRPDLRTIAIDPEVRRALLKRVAKYQDHYGQRLTYNQCLRLMLGLHVEGCIDGDQEEDKLKETA